MKLPGGQVALKHCSNRFEVMFMKEKRWQLIVAVGLVGLSIALYAVHYYVFHDAHHIWIYFVGDLAFLPVEVLLVTLIIHQMLDTRDMRRKLEKLNMVIGTFFSVVGTRLLTYLSDNDPHLDAIRNELVFSEDWSDREFMQLRKRLQDYPFDVDIRQIDLPGMKKFLTGKADLLLRLLENPTMLEHETFTELLRAVFHLTEELEQRTDFTHLPESDLTHLSGDVRRVYGLLVVQWLDYMNYLKDNYPYLFSLAMRTNPFDETASVIIE
jgi:hypothetical protein